MVSLNPLSQMASNKTTSPKLASLASQVLRDPRSSATAKRLAGTALAQAKPHPKKRG